MAVLIRFSGRHLFCTEFDCIATRTNEADRAIGRRGEGATRPPTLTFNCSVWAANCHYARGSVNTKSTELNLATIPAARQGNPPRGPVAATRRRVVGPILIGAYYGRGPAAPGKRKLSRIRIIRVP